jgi:hypothetical protein
LGGRHSGIRQSGFDCSGAQLRGGDIGEGALESPHGRAAGSQDNDGIRIHALSKD